MVCVCVCVQRLAVNCAALCLSGSTGRIRNMTNALRKFTKPHIQLNHFDMIAIRNKKTSAFVFFIENFIGIGKCDSWEIF